MAVFIPVSFTLTSSDPHITRFFSDKIPCSSPISCPTHVPDSFAIHPDVGWLVAGATGGGISNNSHEDGGAISRHVNDPENPTVPSIDRILRVESPERLHA
jgi:hypothetical protein